MVETRGRPGSFSVHRRQNRRRTEPSLEIPITKYSLNYQIPAFSPFASLDLVESVPQHFGTAIWASSFTRLTLGLLGYLGRFPPPLQPLSLFLKASRSFHVFERVKKKIWAPSHASVHSWPASTLCSTGGEMARAPSMLTW